MKVHRATAAFEVGGKKYPPGSYVVKSSQAFRAHVLDMFEPQDHPNDFAYPGAPPTPPYDAAGWTLAYQMGVKFDRILDGFDGPFEELMGDVPPPPARVFDAENAVGFFLHMRTNDSFRAVNQLLTAGEEVRRLKEPFTAEGAKHPPGMFFITKREGTLALLEKIAERTRHTVHRFAGRAGQGSRAAQAGADRPVGPLRRARCRPAGRGGCSNSSSSRSRSSTRRNWTRAGCARSSTC